MATRRAETLIRRIRKETNNEDYGANAGISQTQICEYMNDGLGFLEEGLSSIHSDQFLTTDSIDLVSGTEEYDLPSNLLKGGGIHLVEYKWNSNDFYKMKRGTLLNKANGITGQPSTYIPLGSSLLLSPIPSASKTDGLRITFTERLNRLDVRRGTVDTATLNTGTNTITALSLLNTSILGLADNEFDEHDYICIVDADGAFKMKNIPITGIDHNSGDITVRSGFTFNSGETIAVGDYVVFGKDTSTHQLKLDPSVERFLIAYAAWKVLRQDSNDDSKEQSDELAAMRDSILESYSTPNDDLILVPESGDTDYYGY
jgi:hypothetical protein